MGKKFSGVSQTMSRFRGWIQAGATLLTNLHLPNFLKGGLYQGAGKTVCVPGLNCYSCPAASGACPIGALSGGGGLIQVSAFPIISQAFSCCWGCCWGALSAAFCVPSAGFRSCCTRSRRKKLSTKKLKPLTYLKYAVLLVMVCLLPALPGERCGDGRPLLLQVPLPSGRAGGGHPAVPRPIPASGRHWASCLHGNSASCLSVIVLSVLFYRPFCKWLCPAGCVLCPAEPGVPLPDEGG